METYEYLRLLKKLGLHKHAPATTTQLGYSRRQLFRFAGGQAEIPERLARLLKALDRNKETRP